MPTAPRAPRVYAGQSHAARVAERRRAFVEAGMAIIGSQGYRAATVRAVCARAGLTDRYFYESFAGTEALLQAVYGELAARLKTQLTEATATAPATLEAQTEAALTAVLSFMSEPRIARIMLMEVLGVSAEVTALYLRSTSEFAELLLAAAEAHVPALGRNRGERRVLGQALIGAVIYAASGWALRGYREPLAQVRRGCQRVLVGALREVGAG